MFVRRGVSALVHAAGAWPDDQASAVLGVAWAALRLASLAKPSFGDVRGEAAPVGFDGFDVAAAAACLGGFAHGWLLLMCLRLAFALSR